MALWMRPRYPTPEDPFGETEGFIDDAVRLATLGCDYLELSEVMGNSATRQHLRREMIRLMAVRNIPQYVHHWEEYRGPNAPYQQQFLDHPRPTIEDDIISSRFPHN